MPEKTISLDFLTKKLKSIEQMLRTKSTVINKSQIDSENSFSISSELSSNKGTIHCKQSCTKCESICLFRLSELSVNTHLRHTEIKNELYSHGHPKSRINKSSRKNRSFKEALKELYYHYKTNHFS